jgi:hypothetical protein
MASAKISLQKSGWMLLQSASGIGMGWLCSKAQAKLGITVPADLQAELLATWVIACTSVIHGCSNYIKHLMAERVAVKPAEPKV